MNRYRVLLPVLIDGEYGQGDEFEKDLSPADELANVQSGLIEIVPQRYKVIGGSHVYDTAPGDEFEAAMLLEQEQMLVEGGHIERVEKPAPKKKKGKE